MATGYSADGPIMEITEDLEEHRLELQHLCVKQAPSHQDYERKSFLEWQVKKLATQIKRLQRTTLPCLDVDLSQVIDEEIVLGLPEASDSNNERRNFSQQLAPNQLNISDFPTTDYVAFDDGQCLDFVGGDSLAPAGTQVLGLESWLYESSTVNAGAFQSTEGFAVESIPYPGNELFDGMDLIEQDMVGSEASGGLSELVGTTIGGSDVFNTAAKVDECSVPTDAYGSTMQQLLLSPGSFCLSAEALDSSLPVVHDISETWTSSLAVDGMDRAMDHAGYERTRTDFVPAAPAAENHGQISIRPVENEPLSLEHSDHLTLKEHDKAQSVGASSSAFSDCANGSASRSRDSCMSANYSCRLDVDDDTYRQSPITAHHDASLETADTPRPLTRRRKELDIPGYMEFTVQIHTNDSDHGKHRKPRSGEVKPVGKGEACIWCRLHKQKCLRVASDRGCCRYCAKRLESSATAGAEVNSVRLTVCVTKVSDMTNTWSAYLVHEDTRDMMKVVWPLFDLVIGLEEVDQMLHIILNDLKPIFAALDALGTATGLQKAAEPNHLSITLSNLLFSYVSCKIIAKSGTHASGVPEKQLTELIELYWKLLIKRFPSKPFHRFGTLRTLASLTTLLVNLAPDSRNDMNQVARLRGVEAAPRTFIFCYKSEKKCDDLRSPFIIPRS